jgi:hypothetical protein
MALQTSRIIFSWSTSGTSFQLSLRENRAHGLENALSLRIFKH